MSGGDTRSCGSQFYDDTLGRVCEPKIVRGKDSALDREALRVVRLFPNFTPGTINGKKSIHILLFPLHSNYPQINYGTRKADLQDIERNP
ncbi:energy transducer TonB [Duncaniella muris]|uniref:energy transducer TonB n=1 Tax=Duncaniella muris TaxID=2094150 RepID=UPI003F6620DE